MTYKHWTIGQRGFVSIYFNLLDWTTPYISFMFQPLNDYVSRNQYLLNIGLFCCIFHIGFKTKTKLAKDINHTKE